VSLEPDNQASKSAHFGVTSHLAIAYRTPSRLGSVIYLPFCTWGRTMPFRLTPPTQLTLLISVVLAILAVLLHYTGISIPSGGTHTFGLLLLGYLVLLAGNVIDGI
jgi:hypothetical protein